VVIRKTSGQNISQMKTVMGKKTVEVKKQDLKQIRGTADWTKLNVNKIPVDVTSWRQRKLQALSHVSKNKHLETKNKFLFRHFAFTLQIIFGMPLSLVCIRCTVTCTLINSFFGMGQRT
jgi:hypothetical protein